MRFRTVAMGMAALSASALGVETSPAAPVERPVETSLLAFALPYSPYAFDLAVYASRSFAEVTYGTRRYDPVTKSLIVDGLTVARGDFAARIGQLRISQKRTILDDIAVDTRSLPLDPTVRAVLRRLDRETVTGSISLANQVDAATADYDIDGEIKVDGAGTLDISANVAGFHILVPVADDGPGSQVEVLGWLRFADAAFTDEGLVAALYDVVGRTQGLEPDQARAAAMMTAGIGIKSSFESLPGGDQPAMATVVQPIIGAVQTFLNSPDRLAVAVAPETPFDLRQFTDGLDAQEVLSLSPTAISGPSRTVALIDPGKLQITPSDAIEDVLAAANAFIEGVGLPQDLSRGVGLILPAASDGNRAAIVLLARAVELDPGVEIPQDKLRGTYVAMLLAGADGLISGSTGLDTLRVRLSPEEVTAAEDEARERWKTTPVGAEQRRLEQEAFQNRDWPAIRRLAFDYYEGNSTPRNSMRAYGWASIAAAGGDRIAAELRDDLVSAVNEGRIVLPIAQAREATSTLWEAMVADSTPAAGEGGNAAGGVHDDQGASAQSNPAEEAPMRDGAQGAPDAGQGAGSASSLEQAPATSPEEEAPR